MVHTVARPTALVCIPGHADACGIDSIIFLVLCRVVEHLRRPRGLACGWRWCPGCGSMGHWTWSVCSLSCRRPRFVVLHYPRSSLDFLPSMRALMSTASVPLSNFSALFSLVHLHPLGVAPLCAHTTDKISNGRIRLENSQGECGWSQAWPPGPTGHCQQAFAGAIMRLCRAFRLPPGLLTHFVSGRVHCYVQIVFITGRSQSLDGLFAFACART